ncbi:MAG TPA: hypothetical protein VH373_14435 [Jatrophihabitantaceae bacterium]
MRTRSKYTVAEFGAVDTTDAVACEHEPDSRSCWVRCQFAVSLADGWSASA